MTEDQGLRHRAAHRLYSWAEGNPGFRLGADLGGLNQAVKRNSDRFPEDFVFRLTADEAKEWRASAWEKPVTGSQRHRDPRHTPYAFTEHGAIMAASVLNSPQTIEMSVFMVRAFVRMRSMLTEHRGLAIQLAMFGSPPAPGKRVTSDRARVSLGNDCQSPWCYGLPAGIPNAGLSPK